MKVYTSISVLNFLTKEGAPKKTSIDRRPRDVLRSYNTQGKKTKNENCTEQLNIFFKVIFLGS